MFKSLNKSAHGFVDLGVVIVVGIAFAALMVVGFIIFELRDQLAPTGAALNSINNITDGFDNAISLILVAITIFILAIAISALLMLRGQ
ncbi:unnamed protein product [marine sediment metagenome]|uniref:Uncharacterized protein n=1 Tax=marine sediment metagenome TaxID=412755 RepID=X1BF80_9ZZZZ